MWPIRPTVAADRRPAGIRRHREETTAGGHRRDRDQSLDAAGGYRDGQPLPGRDSACAVRVRAHHDGGSSPDPAGPYHARPASGVARAGVVPPPVAPPSSPPVHTAAPVPVNTRQRPRRRTPRPPAPSAPAHTPGYAPAPSSTRRTPATAAPSAPAHTPATPAPSAPAHTPHASPVSAGPALTAAPSAPVPHTAPAHTSGSAFDCSGAHPGAGFPAGDFDPGTTSPHRRPPAVPTARWPASPQAPCHPRTSRLRRLPCGPVPLGHPASGDHRPTLGAHRRPADPASHRGGRADHHGQAVGVADAQTPGPRADDRRAQGGRRQERPGDLRLPGEPAAARRAQGRIHLADQPGGQLQRQAGGRDQRQQHPDRAPGALRLRRLRPLPATFPVQPVGHSA